MGWFSKKEEVPDLPPAPSMPELPTPEAKAQNTPELSRPFESQGNSEVPQELPSFPATNNNEKLNQEMVKSAVTDIPPLENKEKAGLPELPSLEVKAPEPSIPAFPTKNEGIKSTVELAVPPKASIPQTKSEEPIFVRLDKYRDAKKSFSDIQQKILEIESTISRLNDIRHKEEAEVKGWSEEVSKIKSKLAEIDNSVFHKI